MSGETAPTRMKCPSCGCLVNWDESAPWKPFCSDRCRLIDLGEWFSEERAIPGDEPAPIDREFDD